MSPVDIEDQDAVPSVSEVIADAGHRHVKQAALRSVFGSPERTEARADPGEHDSGCEKKPRKRSAHGQKSSVICSRSSRDRPSNSSHTLRSLPWYKNYKDVVEVTNGR